MKSIHTECYPQYDVDWDKDALDALQEMSEWFLSTWLGLANSCGVYAGRQTLMPKDVRFLADIQYDSHAPVVVALQERNREEEKKEAQEKEVEKVGKKKKKSIRYCFSVANT